MNTYIVLVTYNGMKWLPKTMASIPEDYPVVIVDNKSTDGSIDFLESNFPEAKILQQKSNLGFGKANNLGIKYALSKGANYVFLLNQDAYLIEDVLDKLIYFQIKNNTYGILSPVHLNGRQDKLDNKFATFLENSDNSFIYSDHILKKPVKPVYNVPFINAAAWLISRKCLEMVGGFDPLFFHYGEDDNFCQRTIYHGFNIGVVPNIFIIHDREDRERIQIKPFTDIYYQRRKTSYCKDYGNINDKEGLIKLSKQIKTLKRKVIKAILQAKIKHFSGTIKEIKLLKKIRPQILESRKKNRTKGRHYL